MTNETLLDNLDASLAAQDDLFSDPAVMPLLLLSRYASESVKVCLSGDGGDELFGGYLRHTLWRLKGAITKSPAVVGGVLRQSARLLPASGERSVTRQLKRARSLLQFLSDGRYVRGPFWDYPLNGSGRTGNGNGIGFPQSTEEILDAELLGPLPAHMLVKTDRISMSQSLEVRVPYLDQEVVATAAALPWPEKTGSGIGKRVLREFAAEVLPPAIAQMPKRGFRVPISDWFRHELHDDVSERLMGAHPVVKDFVPEPGIENLLHQHAAGARDHSGRLWALLVLNDWCQRTLDPIKASNA